MNASMSPTPKNISASRRFVDLMTVGTAPLTEHIARSLDELALSYHYTPVGQPDQREIDPPPSRVTYAEIGARFPALGYYAVADPRDPLNEKALVGDAIDDLMDITNDLREVLWRFEQVGVDDANWHFRFLFQRHWGKHLRALASYLHSIQFY